MTGYYQRNPHDRSGADWYREDDERRERAASEAHDYFVRATKPQLQIYTNTIVYIQPWYDTPRWTRDRAAALALYKATTVDAVLLMMRTEDCIFETGEVSEALDLEWAALMASPSVVPSIEVGIQKHSPHKAITDDQVA